MKNLVFQLTITVKDEKDEVDFTSLDGRQILEDAILSLPEVVRANVRVAVTEQPTPSPITEN